MTTNKLSIRAYIHCVLCIKELPPGQSPQDYQRIQTGWTIEGLQIWCVRHDCNIMNIDFEGVKHPANITREAKKK